MAKLKAPLLSLGASGALGKAIVYFPWKGLDVVREYVVPANPRSAAQIVQRNHLENAVDAWHSLAFTDADRIAWNRSAGILADIMSGFNAFMRVYITQAMAGLAWGRVSDAQVDTPTITGFDVDVEDSIAGRWLSCVIGTSRTHLPTRVDLVDDADNTYSLTWAGGGSGIDYYVRIDENVAAAWRQRTGIYHVRSA